MSGKLLSVIVPYFNETPREIFPLLASLNGQVGTRLGTVEYILVNDGSQNVFPKEFTGLFKNMDIRFIYMDENKGPGAARQAGMDNAEGEYVMFADADDALHNVEVLRAFLDEIKNERPDMFGSPWYEETFLPGTGRYAYVLHDNDHTWLHGKAFKRSFLTEKGIRFHEKLRVHEDSYFLTLVAMETELSNTRRLNIISYVWKYRPNSITRRDNAAYDMNSMPVYLDAISYALEAVERRRPERMPFLTAEHVIFYYFKLHRQDWMRPENAEWLTEMETGFRNKVHRYMPYFKQAPADMIETLYGRQRALQLTDGPVAETLEDWLRRLSLI
jgi:glycosyltransferase involved in cell wall biosynthesis